ncbi:hypothetical protein NCCP133_04580 [Cytobacillus sp. NCCP-133]|nr:hypothetical protein NCCP133_04580 [Cytobacillus sp. NCCP-133]
MTPAGGEEAPVPPRGKQVSRSGNQRAEFISKNNNLEKKALFFKGVQNILLFERFLNYISYQFIFLGGTFHVNPNTEGNSGYPAGRSRKMAAD